MKNSLHLTTDDKLNIVDISPALLELIKQREADILGTALDIWIDRDCLRSFLKNVLLASRGEPVYSHGATIHIKKTKLHVLMDMVPTIKKRDMLATKITFVLTPRKQPIDCNPLLKASAV